MNLSPRIVVSIAAVNGLVAVVLGAFGAHALKARLDHDMLSAWQTAVQYHFFHLLALLVVALLMQQAGRSTALVVSAAFFALGILLFCGSLYWLALGGAGWIGPVTPVGGSFFIAGWVSLLVYALRHRPPV